MSVRVHRDPSGTRSVVSGWDGRRTAPFASFVAVLVAGTLLPGLMFDLDGLILFAVLLGGVAILALGVGHRVTIDVDGVRLQKLWLGLAYRQQRIPHDRDPHVSAWTSLDSPEAEGVVLIGDGIVGTDERLIFGTAQRTDAIVQAVNAEIDAIQAALRSRSNDDSHGAGGGG